MVTPGYSRNTFSEPRPSRTFEPDRFVSWNPEVAAFKTNDFCKRVPNELMNSLFSNDLVIGRTYIFKIPDIRVEARIFGTAEEMSSTVLTTIDDRENGKAEPGDQPDGHIECEGCDEGDEPDDLQRRRRRRISIRICPPPAPRQCSTGISGCSMLLKVHVV